MIWDKGDDLGSPPALACRRFGIPGHRGTGPEASEPLQQRRPSVWRNYEEVLFWVVLFSHSLEGTLSSCGLTGVGGEATEEGNVGWQLCRWLSGSEPYSMTVHFPGLWSAGG